jgi:hypothetical protein
MVAKTACFIQEESSGDPRGIIRWLLADDSSLMKQAVVASFRGKTTISALSTVNL